MFVIYEYSTYPSMNTAYYALGAKNRFGEGGLTMVTMQQGQMGVAKFNTMDDSFKHRDNCHALKRNITGMNDKFESGKISKVGYHKLIGVWCDDVESFAVEWSSECVPFDIRDAYNNCVEAIGRRGITTWLELVPIKIGVDFVLFGPPVTTYTQI
jgi:hypothetical protein